MSRSEFGMIGLGTMGRSLMENIANKGYAVSGWNRSQERLDQVLDDAETWGGNDVQGFTDLKAFVESIRKPRVVMLLVPAGAATDEMIDRVIPLLEPGDFIIDGSNAHYRDTDRRSEDLSKLGFGFLGLGVSGGEEGARHGPSMMAGGTPENYERVRAMLEAAAAKYNGEPCVALLGPRSAGHYVKMVHNGIEYAIMQIIAECYDFMSRALEMSAGEIRDEIAKWNTGVFKSYLLEITVQVLGKREDGCWLVDSILDQAKAKGTGKWTSQDAMDLGVPVPTIDEAVCARMLSAVKAERKAASALFPSDYGRWKEYIPYPMGDILGRLRSAMESATLIAYAQGMSQLWVASREYGYDLDLEQVARVWRAGCIVRSELLEVIRTAYSRGRGLANLLQDPQIAAMIKDRDEAFRISLQCFIGSMIPAPALSSSLAYFDSYRSERLPANLTQAQRDLFGAHTYERVDREGAFHTEW